MIRQRLKAGHHEVHEPPDTDPNGATDAVQRDVLAEEAFDQGAWFFVNRSVVGMQDTLAATRLTLMVLLPCGPHKNCHAALSSSLYS
jgi:hypothetical protein